MFIHEVSNLGEKALASPRGGGGQLGAIAPPPTVIRSTPEIRANPKSLGGVGWGIKRKLKATKVTKIIDIVTVVSIFWMRTAEATELL